MPAQTCTELLRPGRGHCTRASFDHILSGSMFEIQRDYLARVSCSPTHYTFFKHPESLGGIYSCFTNVSGESSLLAQPYSFASSAQKVTPPPPDPVQCRSYSHNSYTIFPFSQSTNLQKERKEIFRITLYLIYLQPRQSIFLGALVCYLYVINFQILKNIFLKKEQKYCGVSDLLYCCLSKYLEFFTSGKSFLSSQDQLF